MLGLQLPWRRLSGSGRGLRLALAGGHAAGGWVGRGPARNYELGISGQSRVGRLGEVAVGREGLTWRYGGWLEAQDKGEAQSNSPTGERAHQ